MKNHDPGIKIVQYMHGHFEYFAWSEKICRAYAGRHGYEYVVSREEPRRDRHVVWHKIPTIIEQLHDCDYLLFLDADAVFYSHELTIEEELIPCLGGQSIMMAQDIAGEEERWHPKRPNSGVIFMRNDTKARHFLEVWNNVTEEHSETRWNWPPTQLALWHYVLPEYGDCHKLLLNYYRMQGFYGQYIRHYMMHSDRNRTRHMKAIWARIQGNRDGVFDDER